MTAPAEPFSNPVPAAAPSDDARSAANATGNNVIKLSRNTAGASPGQNSGQTPGPGNNLGNNQGNLQAGKLPPANEAAEQALLGALLHNNRNLEKVSEILKPEYFSVRVHGRIYQYIKNVIDRGQVADPITLKPYFNNDPDLNGSQEDANDYGGLGYLAVLAGSLIATVNVVDYAKQIQDLALRRELIGVADEITNRAHDPELDPDGVKQIELAEAELFNLAETGALEGGFVNFAVSAGASLKMAEAAYRRGGGLTGITTGFRDLDRLLGGLHPSDLVIIAGRPSMGKTALATNISFNAANHIQLSNAPGGLPAAPPNASSPAAQRSGDPVASPKKTGVGFFSLEMSAEQLATRILAERINVSSELIRRGELYPENFEALVVASQHLSTLPLYIDDTGSLTIGSIRTRARRLKRQFGLSLIVIDYLQLITGIGRKENRVQEISDITRGLKSLAKELDVPVVALSQLSRAVEARDDKRPQLADLRDSGTIEQDADVVMFVYREEYYLSRKEPELGTSEHDDWKAKMDMVHNRAELIIAKQRHGPIGNVRLMFDGRTTKFADLADNDGGYASGEPESY
ncbi:MAG: replicative DNA helicase [Candidatus Symbiobacter sp.]|nr:replicative DNA helicase [Candidatus Symbiobacter sp.]